MQRKFNFLTVFAFYKIVQLQNVKSLTTVNKITQFLTVEFF